jgi:hypothetical protein
MHTLTQLKLSMFDIRVDGRAATVDDVFPGWTKYDRLGVVIHDQLGGVGASHLIQLAICCYYDTDERRDRPESIYPEIYAFHVGRGHGSHAHYDFWPGRREVMVGDLPNGVLGAINERAITRLLVPDAVPVERDLKPKEISATHDLVTSAFVYSPTGRAADADVEVAGNDRRTEANAANVLNAFHFPTPPPARARARSFKEFDPEFDEYQRRRAQELTQAEVDAATALRSQITVDGLATERYRRISADEALTRLIP